MHMLTLIFWPTYIKFLLIIILFVNLLMCTYVIFIQDSIFFVTYFNTKFSKKFINNEKTLNRSFLNYLNKFLFSHKLFIITFKNMF